MHSGGTNPLVQPRNGRVQVKPFLLVITMILMACKSCKETLHINEFPKAGNYRRRTCRVCINLKRKGTQKYVPRSKPKIRNAAGRIAQRKVEYLVSRGLIVKPEKCETCKTKTPKEKLHGHHHKGYENPLEIIWICHSCHAAEHAGYLERKIKCQSMKK